MDHCIVYLFLFQKIYTAKSQKKINFDMVCWCKYIRHYILQIYTTIVTAVFRVSGVSDKREIYEGDFACLFFKMANVNQASAPRYAGFDNLVRRIIEHPDFKQAMLASPSLACEYSRLSSLNGFRERDVCDSQPEIPY